ncbi:MAG: hypothetical protein ACTJG2_00285 [Candidatus Saccharimonadales bacterium]
MKEKFMQNNSVIQEELESNKNTSELMLYSIDKTARELADEGDFEWQGAYLTDGDLTVEVSCMDGAYAVAIEGGYVGNSIDNWLVAIPDDGSAYAVSEVMINEEGDPVATELVPNEDPSVTASLSRLEKALTSCKGARGGDTFGVF